MLSSSLPGRMEWPRPSRHCLKSARRGTGLKEALSSTTQLLQNYQRSKRCSMQKVNNSQLARTIWKSAKMHSIERSSKLLVSLKPCTIRNCKRLRSDLQRRHKHSKRSLTKLREIWRTRSSCCQHLESKEALLVFKLPHFQLCASLISWTVQHKRLQLTQ